MSVVVFARQRAALHRVTMLKIALALGILLLFLLGSRLPAEHAKIAAVQSPAWEPEGRYPISFSDRWEVGADAPVPTAILLTALNFWRANMMGMSFGLIMGGAALSLLQTAPFVARLAALRGLRGTLIGMLLGAPLNLCANCAAVTSDGVGRRTRTPETAYGIILGSALWNVVGLAAIAALFPRPVLLARLAFAVLSTFVALPLLARWLVPTGQAAAVPAVPDMEGAVSWRAALLVTLRDWARSSAALALQLIPTMIVATMVAAVARVAVQPLLGAAAGDSIGSIAAFALAGTLISIPVLFDVPLGIVATQLGAGVGGVAALMCAAPGVGIFTVILAARVSGWRLAAAMLGATFVLAVGAGVLAHALAVYGGL